MLWLVLLVVAVTIAAAGYGLHRFLLYAERRGWVYYRTRRRPPGAGLGLLTTIYQPSMEHVLEEEASQRARRDQEESGEGDDDVTEAGS